jgi:hypothetical protein
MKQRFPVLPERRNMQADADIGELAQQEFPRDAQLQLLLPHLMQQEDSAVLNILRKQRVLSLKAQFLARRQFNTQSAITVFWNRDHSSALEVVLLSFHQSEDKHPITNNCFSSPHPSSSSPSAQYPPT